MTACPAQYRVSGSSSNAKTLSLAHPGTAQDASTSGSTNLLNLVGVESTTSLVSGVSENHLGGSRPILVRVLSKSDGFPQMSPSRLGHLAGHAWEVVLRAVPSPRLIGILEHAHRLIVLPKEGRRARRPFRVTVERRSAPQRDEVTVIAIQRVMQTVPQKIFLQRRSVFFGKCSGGGGLCLCRRAMPRRYIDRRSLVEQRRTETGNGR